ncbi:MAG TPA: phytanoyl-CoA dioxygenase family protein [Pilimelia sp.]|nr:phytanoyl-CoA dioxygenase family protein [Pilimelia sp.]
MSPAAAGARPAVDLRAALDADGFVFPLDALTAQECADTLARFQEYDAAALRRGGVWGAFRHFPKVHLAADWADELIRHPRILAAVTELLGPDLLVWSSNVFTRPPHSGDRLAWHQDALHYNLRGFESGAVRVWVALTATTLANGTMRFARGTHREGIVAHRTDADPAEIRAAGLEVDIDVDESRAVPVLLDAGQFSMHHMAVAHCSGPNSTDVGRVNVAIDYLATSVAPVGGPDTAMLVQGTDAYGHFAAERRLPIGTPAAQTQFQQAVALRMRRLGMT